MIGEGRQQIDVMTEIRIERPRAAVAAFSSDPANAPRWYRNIHTVRWVTDGPLRMGSRVAFEAKFLGRRLSYVYEVIDWVPEVRLVMRTEQGPFPMETTYEWHDAAGGTRMTLRNRGRPSGFAGILTPLLGGAVRRANRKDLAMLKAVREGTRGPVVFDAQRSA